MSSRKKAFSNNYGARSLILFNHSYHHFLSVNLPHLLPPPPEFEHVLPPSPPPMHKSSQRGQDIDLRLLNLDPTDMKKQDLYLLLGLQDKRHEASPLEIKTAYRARCLQYHPDKLQQSRNSSGVDENIEDVIFKCIFQAYQILSDPEKRKQYDSVDSNSFDETIPSEDAVPSNDIDTFLRVYKPVFVKNARFSRKQPVPDIGHAYSPREDVENFYSFWSVFESWRTFDFLDEDESQNPENRADKRFLDKKNKANRQRRKNEDNARLRTLFEQAYKIDPRMVRFREDDKLRKEALKLEKEMMALKLAQEKEKERQMEEQRAKEEKERIAKLEAETRREKQLAESKLKNSRKSFKKLLVDNLYFVTDKVNVVLINERSLLIEKFILRCENIEESLRQLQERVDQGQTEEIIQWIEKEYESLNKNDTNTIEVKKTVSEEKQSSTTSWTLPETETLINAVKTHPGGLRDRWVRITEWYNRHISHLDKSLPSRTTEELLKRSNELRQADESPVEPQTDYKALQKKRDPRIDQTTPTVMVDPSVWSSEEQKLLQQGLKTYKADDPNRWEKIAELVGKTKKDCMVRAKEIAQMLKQKKSENDR